MMREMSAAESDKPFGPGLSWVGRVESLIRKASLCGFLRPSAAPSFCSYCFACEQRAFAIGGFGIAHPQCAVGAVLLFGEFGILFGVGLAAVGFVAESDCIGIGVFNELWRLRESGLCAEGGCGACCGGVDDEGTTLAFHDGYCSQVCKIAVGILLPSHYRDSLVGN
jgi:hypothetical protein